jgi:hypothetical protein
LASEGLVRIGIASLLVVVVLVYALAAVVASLAVFQRRDITA